MLSYRQKFLVSKVIDNEKDEAEAAVEATANTAEDLVPIQITDDDWKYPEDSGINVHQHMEMYQSIEPMEIEMVQNPEHGTIHESGSEH